VSISIDNNINDIEVVKKRILRLADEKNVFSEKLKGVLIGGGFLYGGREKSRDIDLLIVTDERDYSYGEDFAYELRKIFEVSLDVNIMSIDMMRKMLEKCDPYTVIMLKSSEKIFLKEDFKVELNDFLKRADECIRSGEMIDYILSVAEMIKNSRTMVMSRYARMLRKILFYLAIVYLYIKHNTYPRSWHEVLRYKREIEDHMKNYIDVNIDIEDLRNRCVKALEDEEIYFSGEEIKSLIKVIEGSVEEVFKSQVKRRLEDLDETERSLGEKEFPAVDKVLDYVEILGALAEHMLRLLCFRCLRSIDRCRRLKALDLIKEASNNQCIASALEKTSEMNISLATTLLDSIRIMRNISYHEPLELGFKILEEGFIFFSPKFRDENMRRRLEMIGYRFYESEEGVGIYLNTDDLRRIGMIIRKIAEKLLYIK